MKYKLIVFDKDGTLCRNRENHTGFINKVEDQEMIPGVVEKCKKLRKEGIELAIASNQGGVAFNYLLNSTVVDLMVNVASSIGTDYWEYCPYHPEGLNKVWIRDHWDRKPRPGMLIKFMCLLEVEPAEVLMVGDRDDDYFAAKRAGCDFQWAHEFFGWDPPDSWAPPDPDHGEGYLGGQDK